MNFFKIGMKSSNINGGYVLMNFATVRYIGR